MLVATEIFHTELGMVQMLNGTQRLILRVTLSIERTLIGPKQNSGIEKVLQCKVLVPQINWYLKVYENTLGKRNLATTKIYQRNLAEVLSSPPNVSHTHLKKKNS